MAHRPNDLVLRALLALSLLAFVTAGAGCARTRAASVRPAEARRAIAGVLDSLLQDTSVPGVVVGVASASGISFAVAAGLADLEADTPMTEAARFHAGSAGKTFFAAEALALAAEGKLRLDDPIARHLGAESWFSRLPNHDAITTRMLLEHTSGLGEYGAAFMDSLVADPGRPRSPLDGIASILDTEPRFDAGSGWAYSDVNYQVLALVIERAGGRPATQAIDARFLRPFALARTSAAVGTRFDGLVQGHAGPGNPFGGDLALRDGAMVFDPTFEGGGGGYVSNPQDLARWMVAVGTGAAYGQAMLEEAMDGVPAAPLGPHSRYGLGLHVDSTAWGPAIGHGGYFPGYLTWMRYYPDRRTAIAIQLNTSDGRRLRRPLEDVLERVAVAVFAER